MADVFALGTERWRGELPPQDGLERLSAILRRPARFGAAGTVLGHAILTVGAGAGAGADAHQPRRRGRARRDRRRAEAVQPRPRGAERADAGDGRRAGVRTGVSRRSATVCRWIRCTCWCRRWSLSCPARCSTFGMVELAYGDMVSGSSRLIAGLVQLVLLAFGLAAGALLVGVGPEDLLVSSWPWRRRAWAPWAGAVVFAVGVAAAFLGAAQFLRLAAAGDAARVRGAAAAPRCFSAAKSAASSARWWRRRSPT